MINIFNKKQRTIYSQEDFLGLQTYIRTEFLDKYHQKFWKYEDWMETKAYLDILRDPSDHEMPGFIGIKRNTSLDYLTSIQEKCYDRRYEYKKLTPYFSGKSVLDIGCKHGDMSLYVGWKYVGLDTGPHYIEEANRVGIGEFINIDFFNYSTKETFDIVVFSHILEHYDFKRNLEFIKRWFLFANTLLISIPQWFDKNHKHIQAWESREEFENMFGNIYNIQRIKETEEFSFNYLFTKK